MILYSPAKINLFLKVVGKRPDGYHELATLMQAVDLFDKITLDQSAEDYFECPEIPDNNLVVRARDLFRRKTGLTTPVSICLEKKIPVQAGLGGGSSNAATTLWGMNALFGKPASDSQLLAWSAEIGSDIPFFFSKGTAYCTGRGENVRDVSPIDKKWHLVKPDIGLSTAEVFKAFKEPSSQDPEVALDQFLSHQNYYFNDLEAPAKELIPALARLKQTLQLEGFDLVQMSGSGTAFFCEGEKTIPPIDGISSYAVSSINRAEGHWYEPKQKASDRV